MDAPVTVGLIRDNNSVISSEAGAGRVSAGASRRKAVFGAAILVVVFTLAACLTFSHVIVTPPEQLSGLFDIYRYYAPLTFFIDHSIHQGELPLWNPLIYCGVPNAGNPQAFLFYPPNLLRSLLTLEPSPYRTHVTLAAMMGVHFIFMGVCTYYCARRHGLGVVGSLVASTAFTFSALMVRRLCEYHYMLAIAWLPLLIVLEKAALEAEGLRKKARYAVAIAFLLGLSILSGFLQVVNLMGVFLGVYGVIFTLAHRVSWPVATYRGILRKVLASVALVGVAVVIASLIASPLLLSVAELASFTERLPGTETPRYSDIQSWTLTKLYQSCIVYAGMRYESETIRGSGVAALVLACVGLTSARRRDVVIFASLFLILFECSLGPPLPLASLLERVTPFSLSAYSRAYDFALFPLSMLAGLGVDALLEQRRSRFQFLLRLGILIYVGLFALVPLAKWVGPEHYLKVSRLVIVVPTAALAMAVATLLAARWKRLSVPLAAGLALLVFSETLAWNYHYVPWMTKRQFKELIPIRQGPVSIPLDNKRDADPVSNRFLFSLRMAMNGVEPLYLKGIRDLTSASPRDKHPFRRVMNYEVARDNQRGNLFLKRSFWLARQYVAGTLPGKQDLFPAATTVFMPGAHDLPIRRVERQECVGRSMSRDALRHDLDRATHLLEPISTPGATARRVSFTLPTSVPGGAPGPAGTLHSALFLRYRSTCSATVDTWLEEPREKRSSHAKRYTVRPTGQQERELEIPLPDYREINARITVEMPRTGGAFQFTGAYVLSDKNDEDRLLRITGRTANAVDLEVGPLPEPRVLTFVDNDYPGWEAYVNGSRSEILRANDLFKAVVLPPGKSHVQFAYAPPRTYHKLTVSLVTLLVMGSTYWALGRTSPGPRGVPAVVEAGTGSEEVRP